MRSFRSYDAFDVEFAPQLTVVRGANGLGKTNLVEAAVFSATLRSFRGATNESLVRRGDTSAIVRARWERAGRELLVEAEIPLSGRQRILLNRQRVDRRSDLLDALPVSVFGPDDLDVVKGGPGGRRGWLDEAVVALDPRNEVLLPTLERVLRQRGALLKQTRGRPGADALTTLDVWDDRLVSAGEALVEARLSALDALSGPVGEAYDHLAGHESVMSLTYRSSWLSEGLAAGLRTARDDDVRRGVSTVGPHRDDVELALDGLPLRTHASQGEQRCAALALRLAVHRLVAQRRGVVPLLILDDVFSELDPGRADALFGALPEGQVLLTTAGEVPAAATVASTLWIGSGGPSDDEPH